MRWSERVLRCDGRGDTWSVYPLGDCHIGARNCAEGALKKVIEEIRKDPKALWFGGGDIIDAVSPSDVRYDCQNLAEWFFTGDSERIQDNISSVITQQVSRAIEIFYPIRDKCLGLLTGNHEDKIRTREHRDVQSEICSGLGVEKCEYEHIWRLKMTRPSSVVHIFIYGYHGWGAGRTAGSEPNKLKNLLDEWESVDIVFRGHSHSFAILPPKPVLYLPRGGKMPSELFCRYRHAANWGCWLYSHKHGRSSYAEKAGYPARPMMTATAIIRPFARVLSKRIESCAPEIKIIGRPI